MEEDNQTPIFFLYKQSPITYLQTESWRWSIQFDWIIKASDSVNYFELKEKNKCGICIKMIDTGKKKSSEISNSTFQHRLILMNFLSWRSRAEDEKRRKGWNPSGPWLYSMAKPSCMPHLIGGSAIRGYIIFLTIIVST